MHCAPHDGQVVDRDAHSTTITGPHVLRHSWWPRWHTHSRLYWRSKHKSPDFICMDPVTSTPPINMDKDFRLLRLLKASEEGPVDEDVHTWDPYFVYFILSTTNKKKRERERQKEKEKIKLEGGKKTLSKLKFVLKQQVFLLAQKASFRGSTSPFQRHWLKSWNASEKLPPPYFLQLGFFSIMEVICSFPGVGVCEKSKSLCADFQQYDFNIILHSRRQWKPKNGFLEITF